MAFRYHEVGYLVREQPRAARDRLRQLFKEEHGNATRVAASLSVDVKTVRRWIAQLAAAGLDPTAKIARPAGRPKRPR